MSLYGQESSIATSDENTGKLEQQLAKLADKMDEKLTRIDEKIDSVNNRLGSIDSTLAGQHVSIKEHIRRTELLENEVLPIKTHLDGLKGIIALLKGLALLATIAEVLHLFKVF